MDVLLVRDSLGQVLVCYDTLGLTENAPPFVRRYAQLNQAVTEAAKAYSDDVKAGRLYSND